MRTAVLTCLGIAAAVSAQAPKTGPADASVLVAKAEAMAATAKKNVFVIYHASW